jgi:hypothetical protein
MKGRGLLTIRVSKNTLSFTTLDTTNLDEPIVYEPYTIKSGISMAANLREAFKETTAVSRTAKAQVLLDAKVLMIPIEQFQESDIEKYYFHTFPQDNQLSVTYNVLPEFNSVAVFAINKDVRLVLRDNVSGATAIHLMAPVWHYLHIRSFTGHRQKLYGYFHDKQLEIFSFQQNRFKFCNNFDVSQANDALYFLLYVWKQLNLQPEHDELHLLGDIPGREWMMDELKRYLQNAYVINPTAEFNRAPATEFSDMPFDLMTILTKGR